MVLQELVKLQSSSRSPSALTGPTLVSLWVANTTQPSSKVIADCTSVHILEKYGTAFTDPKLRTLWFCLTRLTRLFRELEAPVCKMQLWRFWILFKIINSRMTSWMFRSICPEFSSFVRLTLLIQFSLLFSTDLKGLKLLATLQLKNCKFSKNTLFSRQSRKMDWLDS